MKLVPNLSTRLHTHELMDESDADEERLRRTIGQFGVLNALFSRSRFLMRRYFFSVMEAEPGRAWTLLDIGAGGCDLDRWFVTRARRKGIRVSVTAVDHDARIVPWAREACAAFPEITVLEGDALEIDRLGRFDFVFSNHTLHHLGDPDIERVLELVSRSAARAVVLNDLARSIWAYIGYSIFTGLFVHRSFAFYDGRLSIRRGFAREELEAMASRVDSGAYSVVGVRPARLAIVKTAKSLDAPTPSL